MTTGYSGTPLARKLGLKPGMTAYIAAQPQPYGKFFSDLPQDLNFVENPLKDSVDFIHVFCKELTELERMVPKLKPLLKKSGLMWVSWPKGSSKIETDIKREPLRSFVLQHGLVDVKVCAVDEDWSGLKFVYRLKDR